MISVSDVSRNGLPEYNPETGAIRTLVSPRVALPAGLALAEENLWIADGYVLRSMNLATGEVTERFTDIPAAFAFTPSVSGDLLAVSSTFTGTVQVFNHKKGKEITTINDVATPPDALLMRDQRLIYADYTTGEITLATGRDYTDRSILAKGLEHPVQMVLSSDETQLYYRRARPRSDGSPWG